MPPSRKARSRALRIAAGGLIWAAILAILTALVRDRQGSRHLSAAAHVRGWLLDERVPVILELPFPVEAQVGDPVMFGASQPDLARTGLTLIGEVSGLYEAAGASGDWRVSSSSHGFAARLRLDIKVSGHPGLDRSSSIRYITVPQTAAWVMRTLLPEERVRWIAEEWNRTLLLHREELFEAISPVIQALVGDFQTILLEDLPPALERRRAELGRIGERFNQTILKQELQPLIEGELWPILMARAKPALDAIGEEILARLPVWSLSWRFLYQNLPFTADTYVKKEWGRFVESDVIPILREHLPDVFGAFEDVIAEAARNPRVSEAFRRSLDLLLHDRELQHQSRLIFQEIILDNPRFHQAMFDRWRSPEMSEAMDRLSVFLGPLLARLGDAVLGTRGGGITPEFARVLRTQVLEKDRRVIEISAGAGGGEPIGRWNILRAEVARDER